MHKENKNFIQQFLHFCVSLLCQNVSFWVMYPFKCLTPTEENISQSKQIQNFNSTNTVLICNTVCTTAFKGDTEKWQKEKWKETQPKRRE